MPSVRITPNRLNADEHNTKQNLQPKRGTYTHTHTHTHTHTPQASSRYKNTHRRYIEGCDAEAEEKIKDFLCFEIHIPPKTALYIKLPITYFFPSQIVS